MGCSRSNLKLRQSHKRLLTLCFLVLILVSGCGGKNNRVQIPGASPASENDLSKEELVGIASWYGDPHHGRRTSNGEKFDKNAFTAAHRTLPFNTIVRVKNLENGRHVQVRINDRGPFIGGRIIDLSYAAARAIGMIKAGTAKVRLDVVACY